MLAAPSTKKSFHWTRPLVAVGLVALLLVGVWFGGHPSWLPPALRSVFVSKTADERQVQNVLDLISKEYYRPVNTQNLLNDGLEAAVASLHDPYSHYYPPALYKSFEYETNPQVTGIGVEVNPESVDGGIEVEEVIQGSPAAKAGLANGDVIVGVDSHSLSGMTVDAGSSLIKGQAGTTVVLRVRHGKDVRTVSIVRKDVTVPVAASKILDYKGQKLGYLRFAQFTQGSAAQLRIQVNRMLADGAKGLILDLRDNPGGLLTQAIGVASIFVPTGTIVSTRGRDQPPTVYTATGHAIPTSIPLVVLVDKGTASSAEIVTAALQDHARAKVIGTHTYGKGVFQQIQPLPGGGALDITVGEYFTPNGRNLGGGGVKQGAGVTPNIYVYDNPKAPGSKVVKVAEQVVAGEVQ
jgi:carboxyl-terminal processing protease